MERYEGTKMIKTFRGKIADGDQDTIVLHTNDGSTGYKIVKFEALSIDSEEDVESTLKIYSVSQSAIDASIDFSDQTLLAAMIYNDSASNAYGPPAVVIFDNMTFNQDIYITLKASTVVTPFLNYYLELEQVKLDLGENTVATLKDIRNRKTQGF
jgi:hypothetical protein